MFICFELFILLWKTEVCRGTQKWVYRCKYAKQFIPVSLLINYCIIFHMNNWKPTFAPPCVS